MGTSSKKIWWWGAAALLVAPFAVAVIVLGAFVAVFAGGSAAQAAGPVPGLDSIVQKAYLQAVAKLPTTAPQCTGLSWTVLAGIGQVESRNAEGHTIAADGTVTPRIIGPLLTGAGWGGNTTPVFDTDHGQYDGSAVYDAAVGPMQFLPSTWASIGQDGNGDGVKDPFNIFDAALTTATYLCGPGKVNLSDPTALNAAILRYNHSQAYVNEVLSWAQQYAQYAAAGTGPVVAGTGRGAAVLQAAMAYLGTPYSWGGGSLTGPSLGTCAGYSGSIQPCPATSTVGFDCSGLTRFAYAKAAGINLPRTAAAQADVGTWFPASAGLAPLQPGDLVFFSSNPADKSGIHHVGLYMGGGQMLDAAHTGTVVRLEPVWLGSYAGASRP